MIKNSIGFVISLLLSLFVFEVFIQKAEISNPSVTDFDKKIGRKRRANMNYTFFNEGFSMGRFNAYSYLGPPYSPKKEKDVFRIAILGDSFVESFQLFRRDKFHTIIENNVSKQINKKVEVLNFGRSGFDLADMYAYQQRFVNDFNTDLIVYFLANSDLQCKQTDVLIPKVVAIGDSLKITNQQMPKAYLESYQKTKILTQNSSIFQMINNARKLIKSGQLLPKLLDKFYWEKISNEENIVEKPDIPKKAFLILKSLFKNTIIINRDNIELDEYFRKELKKNNIVYIDINDTLNILRAKGLDPNYWIVTNTVGHWNYNAHKAVGEFLSRKLTNILHNNKSSYKQH